MKSMPASRSDLFALLLKPICFIGFTQPGFISIRRHPE
jgi:hypothetical protein